MKTKDINVRLIIPMGLPGSGKTYHFRQHYHEDDSHIYIDFDKYMDKPKSMFYVFADKYKTLTQYHCWHPSTDIDIYLDGLWLSSEKIDDLLSHAINTVNNWSNKDPYDSTDILFTVNEVKIIHFDENREACLNNDRYRREKSSSITIKHAPFEKEISKETIEKWKNAYQLESITVIHMDVHKSTLWELSFQNQCLQSDEWTLAGEWGNCWGAHGTLCHEEAKLFTEFEDFITKLCPDISHSNYAKLFNACCSVKEKHESGYYGSWKDYAYWTCDMEKLYDMMIGMNLISEYL